MSLESDIDLLAHVPLLAGLTQDHLRLLAFSAGRKRLGPGEVLFRRGDFAESGYLVESGAVEVSSDGERQKQACGRGYLIGELPLFVAAKRRATATAVEETTLIELTRLVMVRMLGEYPQIAQLFYRHLSDRVSDTVRDLRRVQRSLLAIDSFGR